MTLYCPIHNDAVLVEREGRYGKFQGSSRYPDCRYIYKEGKKNINAEIFVKLEVIESKIDEILNHSRTVAAYIQERQAQKESRPSTLGGR